MASVVACPVCGADGTGAANEVMAQTLAAQPPVAPSAAGLRLSAEAATEPAARPPIPQSYLGRPPLQPVAASTKLTWYENVWLALPFALVIVGGLIGGACGGAAWGVNKVVFKKLENPILKYVVTGLISGCAAVAWLIIATLVVTAIRRH